MGIVHAGEWVANRKMVEKYPQIFQALETSQRGGGRPFADGGAVGFNLLPRTELISTTYSNTVSVQNPSPYGGNTGGTSADFAQLLQAFHGFRTEISTWQSSFEVTMPYTNFKKKTGQIEADLKAGNI